MGDYEQRIVGQIRYDHELQSLINLIKSNTPEGAHVIAVLRSGNEMLIRDMLKNFGNPLSQEWGSILTASPWTDWQISQAADDLATVAPDQTQASRFWYW